jgi:hypothetical protein
VYRSAQPSGLEGAHSRLFVDFGTSFYPSLRDDNGGVPLVMLAENVVPAHQRDEAEMMRVMQVPPLRSEAAVFEASRRPRLLFCNVPYALVPVSTLNKTLQSVLNPGAVALSSKAGCILSSVISGHHESVSTAKSVSKRNRGKTLVLCAPHSTDVRPLQIPELARALGQPPYEVDLAGGSESEKCGMIGRSWPRDRSSMRFADSSTRA